jgi:hypothetical protein
VWCPTYADLKLAQVRAHSLLLVLQPALHLGGRLLHPVVVPPVVFVAAPSFFSIIIFLIKY